MVRYLIARGADGRQANVYGCSPLYVAAIGGHVEILQLLYMMNVAPTRIFEELSIAATREAKKDKGSPSPTGSI